MSIKIQGEVVLLSPEAKDSPKRTWVSSTLLVPQREAAPAQTLPVGSKAINCWGEGRPLMPRVQADPRLCRRAEIRDLSP
jgi:hypothetical protein